MSEIEKLTEFTKMYYDFVDEMDESVEKLYKCNEVERCYTNDIRIKYNVNIYKDGELFNEMVISPKKYTTKEELQKNCGTLFYNFHKEKIEAFKEKILKLDLKQFKIVEIIEIRFSNYRYLDILRHLTNNNVDRFHTGVYSGTSVYGLRCDFDIS